MITTVPIIDNNGKPRYYYDCIKKNILLANPFIEQYRRLDLEHVLSDSSDDEDMQYYYQKYLFLKSHGYFGSKRFEESIGAEISQNVVARLLEDLNYIVFEVTDSCNLRCKYCGYGDLYYDYDDRNDQFLSFESAKTLIDYLLPYISKSTNALFIGFYGGEPLLNMPFIRQVVDYTQSVIKYRELHYTMTTNAVLLNRNIDYLVEKNFRILISFDGNEYNHSYRAFPDGTNSFSVVYKNVKYVKQNFPSFFEENVSFNSVIHNRNSVSEADSFLFAEFGKHTKFSPLDDSGVRVEKRKEFEAMYHDIGRELTENKPSKQIVSDRFINDPFVFRTASFMNERLRSSHFDTYEELFSDGISKFPGGTCLPFQKKLFLTVNNKILPCERINQQYYLGVIHDGIVDLDFEEIAQTYNHYYREIRKQCSSCYRAEACAQCFFQIDHFTDHYQCHAFLNADGLSRIFGPILDFVEDNPEIPERIINEVILK